MVFYGNLIMNKDAKYLEIFLNPVRSCMNYQPKFGQKDKGINLEKFKELYHSDPFYSWIGLDCDLMYAAHKAAGGMTSIYRQIGAGCEHLFRQIIIDNVGYSSTDLVIWSYDTTKSVMKNNVLKQERRTLTLDARLEFSEITNENILNSLHRWVQHYCKKIDANYPDNGVVFEVRQGYKSKDSKRQNADIENVAIAWSKGYLPIFAIFSRQIDEDNMQRYLNSRAGVLLGLTDGDNQSSLFLFCKDILGYDLAGFFHRNSHIIKAEIEIVLQKLLSAE